MLPQYVQSRSQKDCRRIEVAADPNRGASSGRRKKVDRCHPLLSPTLKISDNLRGPQRLLVTVGMDIKLLESSILRIRRPVLYPLSYGCLTLPSYRSRIAASRWTAGFRVPPRFSLRRSGKSCARHACGNIHFDGTGSWFWQLFMEQSEDVRQPDDAVRRNSRDSRGHPRI